MSHYAASARRGDEEPAPTLPAAKSPTPLAASRRLLAVVAAGSLAAAIGAGGCGGSPERQPTGPFDVSTLGGAEAELTRAEASLARALGDPTLIADAAQTGSPIARCQSRPPRRRPNRLAVSRLPAPARPPVTRSRRCAAPPTESASSTPPAVAPRVRGSSERQSV
ncbi:MAG: hypothetical protein IPM79_00360 [Polyangiaceae bacterium]|nr:hypothetical protein [Polyangiaceae bacterium]